MQTFEVEKAKPDEFDSFLDLEFCHKDCHGGKVEVEDRKGGIFLYCTRCAENLGVRSSKQMREIINTAVSEEECVLELFYYVGKYETKSEKVKFVQKEE